jgi:hypothetical protein
MRPGFLLLTRLAAIAAELFALDTLGRHCGRASRFRHFAANAAGLFASDTLGRHCGRLFTSRLHHG